MSQPDQTEDRPAGERAVEAAGGDMEARLAVLLGKRFYQAAGLLFLLTIVVLYFEAISHVMLVAFAGAIIGIAFNSLIVRLPFSRGIATGIVGVLTLVVIGLLSWFIVAFVAQELRAFVEDLPEISALIEEGEQWMEENLGVDVELLQTDIQEMIGGVFTADYGFAILGGALGFIEVIALALLVLMGAFFVVAEPNKQLLTPILRAVPPERRDAYRRMFHRLGERLTGWLVGTIVSMLVVGTFSTLAFIIIGLPYSILLGVVNALLSIIPIIGAWIGGIVAVLVALLYDPSRVLWVILAVVAIQELEGNLVRPLVMAGSARVHPFMTLLSLLLFASIFGVLGAILSLPIVLFFATIVEVLWVEETLHAGDDEIEPIVKV